MLTMNASGVIIEVSQLHDKRRKDDEKQTRLAKSIPQNSESDKVDNVIDRSAMKIIQKKIR